MSPKAGSAPWLLLIVPIMAFVATWRFQRAGMQWMQWSDAIFAKKLHLSPAWLNCMGSFIMFADQFRAFVHLNTTQRPTSAGTVPSITYSATALRQDVMTSKDLPAWLLGHPLRVFFSAFAGASMH
jgi:hypothetical protein